ncbi:hypothetical protein JCM11251_001064 [Rhodosporidiobolus azoricus]
MLSLFSRATSALKTTARPCACRTAALPSQPTRLFSSFSSSSLSRPSTATASPILALLHSTPRTAFAAPHPLLPAHQASVGPGGQVRGFKSSLAPKKKRSAVARNGGKGKTARRNGALSAKRRRMRIKKIN